MYNVWRGLREYHPENANFCEVNKGKRRHKMHLRITNHWFKIKTHWREIKNFWCKSKNRAKQKWERIIGGIHKFENNRQMSVNLAHIQFTSSPA